MVLSELRMSRIWKNLLGGSLALTMQRTPSSKEATIRLKCRISVRLPNHFAEKSFIEKNGFEEFDHLLLLQT